MVLQKELTLKAYKRGYHLITPIIESAFDHLPEYGVMNIFVKHTSAGITLNENADPSVRTDFETVINTIIPENSKLYTHTLEGTDDMPSHLKSTIIGQSITIPVTNHSLNLGTWQGVYFCEFRNFGGQRQLVITIFS